MSQGLPAGAKSTQMPKWFDWVEKALWIGAALSVIGMLIWLPHCWDAADYRAAMEHVSSYIHGEQRVSLVYSPLAMIPTLSIAHLLPEWPVIALFWLTYLGGWIAQTWAGLQLVQGTEFRLLRCAAPVLAFFPGLLLSDVIISGNIAYVLYGLMFVAAVYGWRHEHWSWFYLAVLLAACVKVHMLTMLAIPLLCARRPWRPALLTVAATAGLYVMQWKLWPGAFQTYLNSLATMSHSSRDFGCGPAGNVARVLHRFAIPYQVASITVYAIYALTLFAFLFWMASLYRRQQIRAEHWIPVMLIGVLLFNPRILTYDAAAFSLPILLVVWRTLCGPDGRVRKPALFATIALLLAMNAFIEMNEDFVRVWQDAWKYLEMGVLFVVFGCGVRALLQEARAHSTEPMKTGHPALAETKLAEGKLAEAELLLADPSEI